MTVSVHCRFIHLSFIIWTHLVWQYTGGSSPVQHNGFDDAVDNLGFKVTAGNLVYLSDSRWAGDVDFSKVAINEIKAGLDNSLFFKFGTDFQG